MDIGGEVATPKPATPKSFSPSRMERWRDKKGLTRRAISDAIHVTEQTVYSWGTGKTVPNADQVAALAMALGVSLDDLFE
jgi:DNA-binding XRE family transcriptional regulator